MLRSHTCGELTLNNINEKITLCGWVQKSRKMGHITFIDLRDRYGITQLVHEGDLNGSSEIYGGFFSRENVLQVTGIVRERSNKNKNLPTGDIEILLANNQIRLVSPSKTPPFTIEDQSDGGDELRMKYRFLDLRRNKVKNNLFLRHRIALETRKYLDELNFIEVETPVLIKSTPEGARDFVVPSRMHPGQFYALPQSPQTFKQLLMVSGFDRYYQIVKCFRDEDLRADRQPEFTQIDCEMSFVEEDDIIETFEGLTKHLFQKIKQITLPAIPRLTYQECIESYGSDKPDIRFGMKITSLNHFSRGKDFKLFQDAEEIAGICVQGWSEIPRSKMDDLSAFVKAQHAGLPGLVFVKCLEGNAYKSTVDKFFTQEELQKWAHTLSGDSGDLLILSSGGKGAVLKALGNLRLKIAEEMGLRKKDEFACLWVTNFPLLEWNEGDPNLPDSYKGRWVAKHHPFTSPKKEDLGLLSTDPGKVRASAYDLVINGVEIGGGSIRIHERDLQEQMFQTLGFEKEEAQSQFGFLMHAFEFGAPPHGGIAFGFDRLCALFGGSDSIRDFIAFPKNNSGRDVMMDSPSQISDEQKSELKLATLNPNN